MIRNYRRIGRSASSVQFISIGQAVTKEISMPKIMMTSKIVKPRATYTVPVPSMSLSVTIT